MLVMPENPMYIALVSSTTFGCNQDENKNFKCKVIEDEKGNKNTYVYNICWLQFHEGALDRYFNQME